MDRGDDLFFVSSSCASKKKQAEVVQVTARLHDLKISKPDSEEKKRKKQQQTTAAADEKNKKEVAPKRRVAEKLLESVYREHFKVKK